MSNSLFHTVFSVTVILFNWWAVFIEDGIIPEEKNKKVILLRTDDVKGSMGPGSTTVRGTGLVVDKTL